jgi:hypothetical protein
MTLLAVVHHCKYWWPSGGEPMVKGLLKLDGLEDRLSGDSP